MRQIDTFHSDGFLRFPADAEMLAWAEERDKSPIRFLPDISAYTR